MCILLPLLVFSCNANSVGPPNDACFNMKPLHNETEPQTTAAPVTFSFSDDNVTANAVIKPGQYIQGLHGILCVLATYYSATLC